VCVWSMWCCLGLFGVLLTCIVLLPGTCFMETKLPDETVELKLPEDTDHVGESAAHVKDALSKFRLPLEEGGKEVPVCS
jgi:hypothetical protein